MIHWLELTSSNRKSLFFFNVVIYFVWLSCWNGSIVYAHGWNVKDVKVKNSVRAINTITPQINTISCVYLDENHWDLAVFSVSHKRINVVLNVDHSFQTIGILFSSPFLCFFFFSSQLFWPYFVLDAIKLIVVDVFLFAYRSVRWNLFRPKSIEYPPNWNYKCLAIEYQHGYQMHTVILGFLPLAQQLNSLPRTLQNIQLDACDRIFSV